MAIHSHLSPLADQEMRCLPPSPTKLRKASPALSDKEMDLATAAAAADVAVAVPAAAAAPAVTASEAPTLVPPTICWQRFRWGSSS